MFPFKLKDYGTMVSCRQCSLGGMCLSDSKHLLHLQSLSTDNPSNFEKQQPL